MAQQSATVEEIDCDEWDSVTINGDHTQVAETATILAAAGKHVVVEDGELNCSTVLDKDTEYAATHYDDGHSIIKEHGSQFVDAHVEDGDRLYVRD